MEIYIWANGYKSMGLVKAYDLQDAIRKVKLSVGEYTSITKLEDENYFDENDVCKIIF